MLVLSFEHRNHDQTKKFNYVIASLMDFATAALENTLYTLKVL